MQKSYKIHQELKYLAYLTEAGIKPLSRWEKQVTPFQINFLHDLGLHTDIISRSLVNDHSVDELIFSSNKRYIRLYAGYFHQQPFLKNPSEKLLEGLLFGYPVCCIRNFIHKGYTPNELMDKGQELLFHWACPGCQVTPLLLPYYREIYASLQKQKSPQLLPQLSPLLRPAVTGLIVLLLPLYLKAENPHILPLPEDTDANHLTYPEEILLGHYTDHYSAGEDSGMAGFVQATYYHNLIISLPNSVTEDSCYAIDHLTYGSDPCPVCGESINMGYLELCNPMRNKSMDITYMALHFMQKGSFSYGDSTDNERIDIKPLKEILDLYDHSHDSLTVSPDKDSDSLPDSIETQMGVSPNNADSNDNGLIDGAEVAEEFIYMISNLPRVEAGETAPDYQIYVQYTLAYGLENCDVCGTTLNMGYVNIINPMQDMEIEFPIMGLHYMAHGKLSYAGSTNEGEIDVLKLAEVLDIDYKNPHLLPVPNDENDNYLSNQEQVLLGHQHEYAPYDLDSLASVIQAQRYYQIIDSLPEYIEIGQAASDSCYKICRDMDGIVVCPVCGQEIAMGYLELHNPQRDLAMNITYMALHFMQNGSFSFDYTSGFPYPELTDSTRVDIEKLKTILASYDHSHDAIIVSPDADNDGLRDDIEAEFSAQQNDSDSNDNGLSDGAEVAENLIKFISDLPIIEYGETPPDDQVYIEYYLYNGTESCDICGLNFNMGDIHIVNPFDDAEIRFPILGLHYLAHGRLAYAGTVNNDEIDAVQLSNVIDTEIIVNNQTATDLDFQLKHYPSPFNARATIEFQLPVSQRVTITLYDITGRKIKTLLDDMAVSGVNKVHWNGRNEQGLDVSSGVYFYAFKTYSPGGQSHKEIYQTRRLLLLR